MYMYMYMYIRVLVIEIVYIITSEVLKKVFNSVHCRYFSNHDKKRHVLEFVIHAYGTFPHTAEVTFHSRHVLSLYVHIHIYEPFCLCMQGWATDSRKILLLDDELDEVLDFGGDRY